MIKIIHLWGIDMLTGEELIEQINQEILNLNLENNVYIKGKDGINNIVCFDEPELYPGREEDTV